MGREVLQNIASKIEALIKSFKQVDIDRSVTQIAARFELKLKRVNTYFKQVEND